MSESCNGAFDINRMDHDDKGFALKEALYDDDGRIYDFRIISANQGMENFFPADRLGKAALLKACIDDKSLVEMLSRVTITGKSSEYKYYQSESRKYVKVFMFRPVKGVIACYYEYTSEAFDENANVNNNEKQAAGIPQISSVSNIDDSQIMNSVFGIEKDCSISINLVAIIDLKMKLIKTNPQWAEIGWSESELLYRSFDSLLYDEEKSKDIDLVEILERKGLLIGYENRIVCKDGSLRWFVWNAHFIAYNNQKMIILAGWDITRNKEIEVKNRDLERAFQLESVKMEFFANISHEFRTPLNIILSALQLIDHSIADKTNRSALCARHYRHLKSIKQNAFRLLRLVNNLIDISKVDSGYLKIYPSNHDIVKIVENITQSVAQYIEGQGICLIFDTDVEEKVLSCDADMIERIMLNLLSNAVKYTEKDGCITVTIKDRGEYVQISVKDTGVGIPEDKLNRIFERFIQVERPLNRRCEGSGIGLSLVKSLVELHSGRIYANSIQNEGSEFTFELPVVIDQTDFVQGTEPTNEEHIHKINVEFSDIYCLY